MTIRYKPLLNTAEITGTSPGPVVAKLDKEHPELDRILTIYRIVEIQNDGSQAFSFDSMRAFACSDDPDGFFGKSDVQDYGRPQFKRGDGTPYAEQQFLWVDAGKTVPSAIRVVVERRKEGCLAFVGSGENEYPLLTYEPTASDEKPFSFRIVPQSEMAGGTKSSVASDDLP